MKNILISFYSVVFFILSGCAPVDYSKKSEQPFPEANKEQALIYFYRTPGLIGSTYRFNVYENKQIVGAMAQDSYFYLYAEPGKHKYSVNDQFAEQGPFIELDLQAGNTYYVKIDVDFQVIGGKVIFTQVAKDEAMKLLLSRIYVLPAKIDSSTYNVYAE